MVINTTVQVRAMSFFFIVSLRVFEKFGIEPRLISPNRRLRLLLSGHLLSTR